MMERMAVAAWSDERLTINVERLRFNLTQRAQRAQIIYLST